MENFTHGRFVRHDIRLGMDVYTATGDYLGSVRRVGLAPAPSATHGSDEIADIDVGSPWRPSRRRMIGIERVQTVTMERVVLVAAAR